jgi:hypothetical protein
MKAYIFYPPCLRAYPAAKAAKKGFAERAKPRGGQDEESFNISYSGYSIDSTSLYAIGLDLPPTMLL